MRFLAGTKTKGFLPLDPETPKPNPLPPPPPNSAPRTQSRSLRAQSEKLSSEFVALISETPMQTPSNEARQRVAQAVCPRVEGIVDVGGSGGLEVSGCRVAVYRHAGFKVRGWLRLLIN